MSIETNSKNKNAMSTREIGFAVRIVRPVVHLLPGAIVAAANWDMKLEKETSINLDVRSNCATLLIVHDCS